MRHTKLRDGIAATLAAIFVTPFLIGAPRGAPPKLPAGPLDAGTILEVQEEADREEPRHLPAGERESATDVHASKPTPKTPAHSKLEVNPAAAEAETAGEPPLPTPSASLSPQRQLESSDEVAEAELAPTDVERRPKPVAAMTAQEVQQTVAQYRSWVFKGRIKLTLDLSQIHPDDLPMIASYFLLTQVDAEGRAQQQELIDSSGRYRDDQRESLADDILTGDLRSQDHWPSALVKKARESFGPRHRAYAKFYLSDAWALRIYRVLAQAVKGREVPPGTEFVMQLLQDAKGQLQIQILDERAANQ